MKPHMRGCIRSSRDKRDRKKSYTGQDVEKLDELPLQESMNRSLTGRKDQRFNVKPLKRWIASQVGRQFDKVYAEFCMNFNRDRPADRCCHEMLPGYIEMKARLIDGVVSVWMGVGEWGPITKDYFTEFYVCPKDGILKKNKGYSTWKYRNKREPKTDIRWIDDNHLYMKLDGLWFWVEVRHIQHKTVKITFMKSTYWTTRPLHFYDIILKFYGDVYGCRRLYGKSVYATKKRQIGKRELKRLRRELDEG